ncbi:MAG: MBL fold metallo-hydrolase [Firmicutes bacterium]|nr:MBL fold metallo-hydrolase [Bacillota bacterium]
MLSNVKVTTLCENSAPAPSRGVMGEHGMSMLLEAGGKRILFDTGGGLSLLHNARRLNVDLGGLDGLVLSHGHYDHTGGLKYLLEQVGSLSIYAHPDVFADKYHLLKDEEPRRIGIPWPKEELEHLGARFSLSRGSVKLGEEIILTGEIPRRESREENTATDLYYKKPDGSFAPDLLADDQAVIVESTAGTIVLLGCAHSGLINTLRYVCDLTGKKQIYACIGGTHLMNASNERLEYTIEALREFDLQQVAPCHCTGPKGSLMLFQAFGDRFAHNPAGTVFNFG